MSVMKPENLFADQLNKIYCCQTHTFERLSEISDDSSFADLSKEIDLTLSELDIQIAATENIYQYLNCGYSFDAHEDLVSRLESEFYIVQKNSNNKSIRNAALSTYVKLIHSSIASAYDGMLTLPTNRDEKIAGFIRNGCNARPGMILTKLLS